MNEKSIIEYFLNYVYNKVDKNKKLLRRIKPYEEHRKEYLRIIENYENKKDKEYLKLLSSISGITRYENACAYCLGMLDCVKYVFR